MENIPQSGVKKPEAKPAVDVAHVTAAAQAVTPNQEVHSLSYFTWFCDEETSLKNAIVSYSEATGVKLLTQQALHF